MSDRDAWPAWATQTVEVVPADPAWQQRGADLAAEVGRLLGPPAGAGGSGLLASAVRHVGSTAVPGLDAKAVLERLRPHGWHWVPPELDGRPYERFFVQARGDSRTAHLHLHLHGDPRPGRIEAFRDRLRADPGLAARYGELKHRLGAEHADDREAYTRAKSRFVEDVLAGTDPA